jgi:hypothetical protein
MQVLAEEGAGEEKPGGLQLRRLRGTNLPFESTVVHDYSGWSSGWTTGSNQEGDLRRRWGGRRI